MSRTSEISEFILYDIDVNIGEIETDKKTLFPAKKIRNPQERLRRKLGYFIVHQEEKEVAHIMRQCPGVLKRIKRIVHCKRHRRCHAREYCGYCSNYERRKYTQQILKGVKNYGKSVKLIHVYESITFPRLAVCALPHIPVEHHLSTPVENPKFPPYQPLHVGISPMYPKKPAEVPQFPKGSYESDGQYAAIPRLGYLGMPFAWELLRDFIYPEFKAIRDRTGHRQPSSTELGKLIRVSYIPYRGGQLSRLQLDTLYIMECKRIRADTHFRKNKNFKKKLYPLQTSPIYERWLADGYYLTHRRKCRVLCSTKDPEKLTGILKKVFPFQIKQLERFEPWELLIHSRLTYQKDWFSAGGKLFRDFQVDSK